LLDGRADGNAKNPFGVAGLLRAANDPRKDRYGNREQYLERVNAAAADLVARRFVLAQDREFIVDRAARLWDALM